MTQLRYIFDLIQRGECSEKDDINCRRLPLLLKHLNMPRTRANDLFALTNETGKTSVTTSTALDGGDYSGQPRSPGYVFSVHITSNTTTHTCPTQLNSVMNYKVGNRRPYWPTCTGSVSSGDCGHFALPSVWLVG
jgi:hypothetical protein